MARLPRPAPRMMDDVLDEHLEALEFLLPRRQRAWRAPDYTAVELGALERRIGAHIDGLVVGGAASEARAIERLGSDDAAALEAAAYALLRLERASAATAFGGAFQAAAGEALAALGAAARLALPVGPATAALEAALRSGAPAVAAQAAEALAFQGRLAAGEPRLDALAADGDGDVRAAAWRAIALVDARAAAPPERAYRLALGDGQLAVRDAALLAGAWTRQGWVLDRCRKLALHATAPAEGEREGEGETGGVALRLLAVLGTARELDLLRAVAGVAGNGSDRFALLGAFGHPGIVGGLIDALSLPDPGDAASAAAAFTRVTGVDVGSGKRAKVRPGGPTAAEPIDEDLLDEVAVPDAEKARSYWAREQARYAAGTRWARGQEIGRPGGHLVADGLDLETRWEAFLRARHEGAWSGDPSSLERFGGLTSEAAAPTPRATSS